MASLTTTPTAVDSRRWHGKEEDSAAATAHGDGTQRRLGAGPGGDMVVVEVGGRILLLLVLLLPKGSLLGWVGGTNPRANRSIPPQSKTVDTLHHHHRLDREEWVLEE